MNILKTIFINSIIYKLFLLLLVIYKNSYFKIFCGKCHNIYKNSFIYSRVDKYMNSTPLYKYSFIKKINESFYNLVVNHSKWIYNFVSKTFNNSFFINLIKKQYNIVSEDRLKNGACFSAMFFLSFALTSVYLQYPRVVFAIAIFMFVCSFVVFLCSNALKRIFYNSFIYSFVIALLKMEVSNEKD